MAVQIFESTHQPTRFATIKPFAYFIGIMGLLFAITFPNFYDIFSWKGVLFLILALAIPVGWAVKRTNKLVGQKPILTFSETGISHSLRDYKQHISFDAIQQVLLLYNKRMEPMEIMIISSERTINLKNYPSLPRIFAALQLRLQPQTAIRKARAHSWYAIFTKYKFVMRLIGFLFVASWIISAFFGLSFSLKYGFFALVFWTAIKSTPVPNRADKMRVKALGIIGSVWHLFIVFTLLVVLGKDSWWRPVYHPCGYVLKFQEQSGCIRVLDNSEIVAFLNDDIVVREVRHSVLFESIDGNPWFNNVFAKRLHHKEYVRRFDLSPDGSRLLLLQANSNIFNRIVPPDRARNITLWNVPSREMSQQLFIDSEHDFLVDISAAGGYAAIDEQGESDIEIWDVSSEQLIGHTNSDDGWLIFSADGSLYAASNEQGIVLFDIQTGESGLVLSLPESINAVDILSVTFSDNGRFLAARTLATTSILVWDLSTGQLKAEAPTPDSSWESVFDISPDGRYLAFTEKFDVSGRLRLEEAFVNVWDINNGELAYRAKLGRERLMDVESIAFSPGNRVLGVGIHDEIILFELSQMPKPGQFVAEGK